MLAATVHGLFFTKYLKSLIPLGVPLNIKIIRLRITWSLVELNLVQSDVSYVGEWTIKVPSGMEELTLLILMPVSKYKTQGKPVLQMHGTILPRSVSPTNVHWGGGAFINQWDEAIQDMRELGQKPNDFMEKILFKEWVYDIDYTPILYVIIMMDPPSNIDQFK